MDHPTSNADANLAGSMPRQNVTEDVTQSLIAGAMDMIPVLGGPLSRAFEDAANLVANREREKWLLQLAGVVDNLASARDVTVEELVEDDLFYEAAVRASRSAQATTREAKRKMLAEAVRHSGSWSAVAAHSQRYLHRLVDRMEPEHVTMLSIIADPSKVVWPDQVMAGGPIEQVVQQLRLFDENVQFGVAQVVLRDLFQEGLTTEHLGLAYDTTPTMLNPRDHHTPISPLGREFLAFVGNP